MTDVNKDFRCHCLFDYQVKTSRPGQTWFVNVEEVGFGENARRFVWAYRYAKNAERHARPQRLYRVKIKFKEAA